MIEISVREWIMNHKKPVNHFSMCCRVFFLPKWFCVVANWILKVLVECKGKMENVHFVYYSFRFCLPNLAEACHLFAFNAETSAFVSATHLTWVHLFRALFTQVFFSVVVGKSFDTINVKNKTATTFVKTTPKLVKKSDAKMGQLRRRDKLWFSLVCVPALATILNRIHQIYPLIFFPFDTLAVFGPYSMQ